jgi:hypothetical protein
LSGCVLQTARSHLGGDYRKADEFITGQSTASSMWDFVACETRCFTRYDFSRSSDGRVQFDLTLAPGVQLACWERDEFDEICARSRLSEGSHQRLHQRTPMRLTMTSMLFHPTITALTAAHLPLAAGDAVAGRKLMGSAGLRQPAAHS